MGPVWPRGCWGWLAHGLTVIHPQARLEVHRFGITGYGKGKERVLERERAIMLGAKVRAAAVARPGGGDSPGALGPLFIITE